MLGSVSVPGSGRARGLMPDSFSAAVSSIEAADLQARYGFSLPLHSLVSDVNHADNRPGLLATHPWNDLQGADLFFKVSQGLYVCPPELVFLQLASLLVMEKQIKLGFELCGCYRFGPEGVEYNCDPLTSRREIQRSLNRRSRVVGLQNARRALEYVRDGSNSPRETALAMLLGLPYRLGGASFGMPLMNHPIELSDESRRLANQRICKCDLYYPKSRLDLEYESYEYHSGPLKMEHDSMRRDALALMGVTVLTVTNMQIIDQGKLNVLVQLVSKITGKRFRPQCREYYLKQRRLMNCVFDKN